jgi:hypothetical protein
MDQNNDTDLYSVKFDGTGTVVLTATPDYEELAAITPDDKIIFWRQVAGNMDIYIINDDGTGAVALAASSDDEFYRGMTKKPNFDSGQFGHGITSLDARVTLRDAIIAENSFIGVAAFDSPAVTITRTVVRDTRSAKGGGLQAFYVGTGINLSSSYSGKATPLTLANSAVVRNQFLGVALWMIDAAVTDSVVSGTTPSTQDGLGLGGAWLAAGSSLLANSLLIAENCRLGLTVLSTRATVERSIVRDTRSINEESGIGVQVVREPDASGKPVGPPAELTLRDSLVAANGFIGILAEDSDALMERTVVRDTRSQRDSTGFWAGTGINASSWQDTRSFVLRDAVVSRNRYLGVALSGVEATIERTLVRDTQPIQDGVAGSGIGAQPGYDKNMQLTRASHLALSDSNVTGSRVAGIIVVSSAASISRCAIHKTTTGKDDVEQGWGDGIAAWHPDPNAETAANVMLEDSLVEDSARAGLVFDHASGSVRRSVFRRGVLAIDLEEAAAPEIGDDNVFEGNVENRVTWGNNLAPSPPPKMPPPLP